MLHVDQTVNGVAQFSLEPRLGAAVVQNPGCNKNDARSTPLYFESPPLVCSIFQVRLCFNMFRQGIHTTDVQFMRQNASGWDIILQRAEHNARISSFHLFHVYTFMIIHDVRLPRLMVLAILEYHDGAHGMECLFVSVLLLEFYNFWISPNKQHVLSWALVSQWWYLVCNVKVGIQSWGIHPKNMGTKMGSLISIKGPDNPTNQLLPMITKQMWKWDGKGMKERRWCKTGWVKELCVLGVKELYVTKLSE